MIKQLFEKAFPQGRETEEAGAVEAPAAAGPQKTPDQASAGHYVERLDGLYAHARETRSMHVLVDVIAWSLARLANEKGPSAAGHILRGFGWHLTNIADAETARLEAEKAKASGQRPH